MTITEMRETTYEAYKAGKITLQEAREIELYLNKREYRQMYNKREEVVLKRKAYNRERAEKAKIGRQMLNLLLGSKEDNG